MDMEVYVVCYLDKDFLADGTCSETLSCEAFDTLEAAKVRVRDRYNDILDDIGRSRMTTAGSVINGDNTGYEIKGIVIDEGWVSEFHSCDIRKTTVRKETV